MIKPRAGILNNVGTDWRLKDGRERVCRAAGRAISRIYRDRRASRHFVGVVVSGCCVLVVIVNVKLTFDVRLALWVVQVFSPSAFSA